MNPPRRTLEAALQTPDLPPAAFAIIKEGTPKPMTSVPLVASQPSKPVEQALAPEPRQAEQPKARIQKERGTEPVSFVSISVRVPSRLPEALLRAASERKLKKIRPYTQQDIVAEAVQEWLQKRNYSV